MIIAVDFDGTVIWPMLDYGDVAERLRIQPGARETLTALSRAGHTLILYSARANLALREDWRKNPLWSSGALPFHEARWREALPLHRGRYLQMVEFVGENLPGLFAAIDDGGQGKPMADVFLDDRGFCPTPGKSQGFDWPAVLRAYGRQPVKARPRRPLRT